MTRALVLSPAMDPATAMRAAGARMTFLVPGVPVPKKRPRVTSRGTFMPEHYTAWKELVRDEAAVVFAELADRGTPWDAEARAYAIGCRFFLSHSNGGDIDSLLGGVMDALNRFAFPDDRLVLDVLHLAKRVDKARPRVEVELRAGGLVDLGDDDDDEARPPAAPRPTRTTSAATPRGAMRG